MLGVFGVLFLLVRLRVMGELLLKIVRLLVLVLFWLFMFFVFGVLMELIFFCWFVWVRSRYFLLVKGVVVRLEVIRLRGIVRVKMEVKCKLIFFIM